MEITRRWRREALERLLGLLYEPHSTPYGIYRALFDVPYALVDEDDETHNVLKLMAMIAPQLPDGAEWPKFDTGALVGLGDEVGVDGRSHAVDSVLLDARGAVLGLSGGIPHRVERGARVEREPDSWERLIGDAVAADDEGERGMCEALVLRAKALAGGDR